MRLIYKFHHKNPMICCQKLSLPDCRIRLMTKWSNFLRNKLIFWIRILWKLTKFPSNSSILLLKFLHEIEFTLCKVFPNMKYNWLQMGIHILNKRSCQKPEQFIFPVAGFSIMGIMYSCLLLTWTKDHWYGQFRHDNRH